MDLQVSQNNGNPWRLSQIIGLIVHSSQGSFLLLVINVIEEENNSFAFVQ